MSQRKELLDFQENVINDNSSYTIIKLENLNRKNIFSRSELKALKEELSSIYRDFLRRDEIQINIIEGKNSETLEYHNLEILNYPYYETLKPGAIRGEDILWTAPVHCEMFKKEIRGYICILKEMSEKKSGLVVKRRGRVIVGESPDHLYHPKCIFGAAKNSHQYKRIYGEIEIKGFSASFNKNGFSNLDELEIMLELLKKKIIVNGFSLLKQASELRFKNSDTSTPPVQNPPEGPTRPTPPVQNPPEGPTRPTPPIQNPPEGPTRPTPPTGTNEVVPVSKEFMLDGDTYLMKISKDYNSKTLLAIEIGSGENEVICKINPNMVPNRSSDELSEDIINLLLSLGIGMFRAQMKDEDTCENLFKYMNEE